jgi:hypothetical protein
LISMGANRRRKRLLPRKRVKARRREAIAFSYCRSRYASSYPIPKPSLSGPELLARDPGNTISSAQKLDRPDKRSNNGDIC